jgi:hypothetical protein
MVIIYSVFRGVSAGRANRTRSGWFSARTPGAPNAGIQRRPAIRSCRPVHISVFAGTSAPAGPPHHRRRRHLLHLGLVRSRHVTAMVGGPHNAARRRLPPDVPVHGTGCGTGGRGRRRARRLSAARIGRPGRCARALRAAAPAARHLPAADVACQQAPLPYARRPRAGGARCRTARAGDRSPEALRWLYGYDPAALELPAL